jgi:hypothetical protein
MSTKFSSQATYLSAAGERQQPNKANQLFQAFCKVQQTVQPSLISNEYAGPRQSNPNQSFALAP